MRKKNRLVRGGKQMIRANKQILMVWERKLNLITSSHESLGKMESVQEDFLRINSIFARDERKELWFVRFFPNLPHDFNENESCFTIICILIFLRFVKNIGN